MRTILIFPLLVTLATAQFFGGGNFAGNIAGNFAGAVQQGFQSVAARVPSVPVLSNVNTFAEFAVSNNWIFYNFFERTLLMPKSAHFIII